MAHPGLTSIYTNSLATTNSKLLKSSGGVLQCVCVFNATGATKYLKLYNKATAPTVGTDIPVLVIAIPATSSKEIEFGGLGKIFDTGIGMGITGGAANTDTTAVAAGDVVAAVTFL